MTGAQVDRYLRLLGVPRRAPTLDALAELVRAHLARVPFENVSKLVRFREGLRAAPDLETHLDGIERSGLGGTCYANAAHLHQLLLALGYEAVLCGADMSRPDVHAVVVVTAGGRDHLVDVGFGAPFVAPMPLDLERDVVVALGRDRYVLRPRDARGRSTVEQHRDGALREQYVVNPVPRDLAHFQAAIADSFRTDSVFLNKLIVARFWPDRGLVLRNLTLVEQRGDREVRRAIADRAELVDVAAATFGIPRAIVAEAVAALPRLGADRGTT